MRIYISAKCSDMCDAVLYDNNGYALKYHDGYVPDIIPNSYNDYVELDIELETGKILNWKVPTKEEIDDFINLKDNE
jgi:hypothetical protein